MTDLPRLTAEEQAELDELVATDPALWRAMPGPQDAATESLADVTGFGGAGGGGKSDWICGLACTRHRKAIIFRETGTELVGINSRLGELLAPVDGQHHGKDNVWRYTRRDGVRCSIELGSFPDLGDEQKYRGRDHDLLAFDEATTMREQQVRFLFAWARSVDPKQRVRIVMTFNPPQDVEGRWIIAFFAPWLDPKHPRPALPGEIRWFATVAGVDMEVPDDKPFVLVNATRQYDFDPAKHRREDIIRPSSRTFVPSRVVDNPFLRDTGYMRVLQALPEPHRSQMLHGDFRAGMQDDAFQVIPTAWVEASMARWKQPDRLDPMDSMGIDVAMKGDDEHVIICRHDMWFAQPIAHKGTEIPDGAASGAHCVAALRDAAVMHLDLFGVGSLTYGFLMSLQLQVVGVNFGDLVKDATDETGKLRFSNLRSYLWWRMREVLNPLNNTGIALPPHKRLLADLTAPKYKIMAQRIRVQSRDDIVKELGRSPDYGTAAILALIDTPKVAALKAAMRGTHRDTATDSQLGHDPFAIFDSDP